MKTELNSDHEHYSKRFPYAIKFCCLEEIPESMAQQTHAQCSTDIQDRINLRIRPFQPVRCELCVSKLMVNIAALIDSTFYSRQRFIKLGNQFISIIIALQMHYLQKLPGQKNILV